MSVKVLRVSPTAWVYQSAANYLEPHITPCPRYACAVVLMWKSSC